MRTLRPRLVGGHSLPQSFGTSGVGVVLLLLAVSPILVYYVVINHLPVGSAGLYSLMADSVSFRGLTAARHIPYYGPDGMPFAYPPLAFYVMALIRSSGITAFAYVRLMPAVYVGLVVMATYYLAFLLTNSKPRAVVCSLLTILSPVFLSGLLQSGGIVRALACALMIVGMAISYKALSTGLARYSVYAGVALGLTGLVHLYYFMILVATISVFAVAMRGNHTLRTTIFVYAVGAVITLPWALNTISNYGLDTLLLIFPTHLGQPGALIARILHLPTGGYIIHVPTSTLGGPSAHGATSAVTQELRAHMPPLEISLRMIPASIAMLCLIAKRQFLLPLWSFALLAFGSSSYPFLVLVSSIAIVKVFGDGFESLVTSSNNKGLILGTTAILCVSVVAYLYVSTVRWVVDAHSNSSLWKEDEVLAAWFHQNTGSTDTFAVVDERARDSEEWLPYLFQRAMVGSPWGGEWTGRYDSEGRLRSAINDCGARQSLLCFTELMDANDRAPRYVVIHEVGQARILVGQIEESSQWELAYYWGDASVWQRRY